MFEKERLNAERMLGWYKLKSEPYLIAVYHNKGWRADLKESALHVLGYTRKWRWLPSDLSLLIPVAVAAGIMICTLGLLPSSAISILSRIRILLWILGGSLIVFALMPAFIKPPANTRLAMDRVSNFITRVDQLAKMMGKVYKVDYEPESLMHFKDADSIQIYIHELLILRVKEVLLAQNDLKYMVTRKNDDDEYYHSLRVHLDARDERDEELETCHKRLYWFGLVSDDLTPFREEARRRIDVDARSAVTAEGAQSN